MAAFATRYDLANRLGLTFEDAEAKADQFDAALEAATDQIRQVCGWSITQETVVNYPLTGQIAPGRFPQRVFLPTLRLTAVTVTVGGQVLSTPDLLWDTTGVLTVFRAPILCGPRLLVTSATFTHGYATAPSAVVQACVDLAGEAVSNPQRLLSVTKGPFTENYGAIRPSVTEDARIRAFMLPGVA